LSAAAERWSFWVIDAGPAPGAASVINFRATSGKASCIRGARVPFCEHHCRCGHRHGGQRQGGDRKLYQGGRANWGKFEEDFGHECGEYSHQRESVQGAVSQMFDFGML
jgi:hypothetical protein